MVIKFLKIVRSVHSLLNISKTNIMNKHKCYFRYIKQDDKVDISFLFSVNDVSRQFNLSRNSSESLETLCVRIATNVQKFYNKKNKKKTLPNEQAIEVKIYDSKKDPISKECTCSDLFAYQSPILSISDKLYEIVLNAPWIINFNLPKTILAGFPVYPENFETQYTDKHLSIFNWYKGKSFNDKGNEISNEHIQWQLILNSFYFTPTTEDIGMKLKLECIPGIDIQ